MAPRPDYLVIGHITRDIYEDGYNVGGTATFSSLTARNLGHRAGILTSVGPDVELARLPGDILVAVHPSQTSTAFQNVYQEGVRSQFIWSRAQVLAQSDVPAGWEASPIVHLGPVAQEIEGNIVESFPDAMVGLTPQGWMRTWDAEGRVSPQAWNPSTALLERADAVIMSEEDVGRDMRQVHMYAARTQILVLTAGWRGASVYYKGEIRSFAAPQVNEVDPTGAGDIFAAAFFSALHKTQDPWLAARFANCVAAHSVERTGLNSVPSRAEIEACHARFPNCM